jgi:protein-disulfide isomerase
VNYPYKYRDYSFGAAEALLAAGDQGKFWEMHDLMIENSPDLDKDSLVKYAEKLGLDMARFGSDLAAMKHKAQVDADVKMAHDLDLYNTPTFFINGRMVVGNRPYSYLKKIVEEELQSAGK